MVFPVVMYGYESWIIKKTEHQIIYSFELWSWRRQEIKPVHRKRNPSWILIGRTDAEAQNLWPPDVKSWLIRKDPDAGKDWRPDEKGMIVDELVAWHHWLHEHEFEQDGRDGEGLGSLACCNPCSPKSRISLSSWTTKYFNNVLPGGSAGK